MIQSVKIDWVSLDDFTQRLTKRRNLGKLGGLREIVVVYEMGQLKSRDGEILADVVKDLYRIARICSRVDHIEALLDVRKGASALKVASRGRPDAGEKTGDDSLAALWRGLQRMRITDRGDKGRANGRFKALRQTPERATYGSK